jgi:hypothetical protein
MKNNLFSKVTLVSIATIAGGFLYIPSGYPCGGTSCVTPTQLTLSLTKLVASTVDGSDKTLYEDATGISIVLKKSDTDFVEVSLGSVTIPDGRYEKLTTTYGNNVIIKIDGEKVKGGETGMANGSAVYSKSTNGVISASGPAEDVTVDFSKTASMIRVVSLPSVVCVGAASTCQAGDLQVGTGTSLNLKFQLVFDLYNSIPVYSFTTTLNPSGLPKLGGPLVQFLPAISPNGAGAAIHLSHPVTSGVWEEVSLLFDSSGSLISALGSPAGNTLTYKTVSNFCGGSNFVTVTACPSGVSCNTSLATNYTQVSRVTNTAGGVLKVDYPVSTGFSSSAGAQAEGMVTWSDLRKAVGSTVSVQCLSPSTAPTDKPGLGYTYSLASSLGNGTGTNSSFVVTRIVDGTTGTNALFSTVCSTAASSGKNVCGSYP